MNNAEIQIQFPDPGKRGEFNMTAIYRDADGYAHTDRYTAAQIPAEQAPAMEAVVAALVGLKEPWQASQVWARLGWTTLPPDKVWENCQYIEVVSLTVEAVNAQGGRRTFTATDYPEFDITAPEALAFFKHFTNR